MDTLNVWNTINDKLTNFVVGKVNDRDLAKDIVQDVFVKVFTKANTLRDNDKMVSWIYQIARNEVINHFRSTKIKDLHKEIDMIDTPNEALTSEMSECLHPLINSLPDKYREALILADIERIPQKEIAERLNISYSGAKSRVQRGRDMLKQTLEQCCAITTDVYGDVLDYKQKKCNPMESGDCDSECD